VSTANPDLVKVLTPPRTYDAPAGLKPEDCRHARIMIADRIFGFTVWRYDGETNAQLEQRARDELAREVAECIRSGNWGEEP
jgi:hypothetical protein